MRQGEDTEMSHGPISGAGGTFSGLLTSSQSAGVELTGQGENTLY